MIEIKAKKNKVKEDAYDILVHYNGEENNQEIVNIIINVIVDLVNKMVEANKDVSRKTYFEVISRILQMLADKEQ